MTTKTTLKFEHHEFPCERATRTWQGWKQRFITGETTMTATKSEPTPGLPWLANPVFDGRGEMPEFYVNDRLLIAVPLHKGSGGGYDYDVIAVDEIGFNDRHGEYWGDWDWSDVEFYIPLDGERKVESDDTE
jgi:hypothetical protein